MRVRSIGVLALGCIVVMLVAPGTGIGASAPVVSGLRFAVTVSLKATVSARTGAAHLSGTVRCDRTTKVNLRLRLTQAGKPLPLESSIDPLVTGASGGPAGLNDIVSGPVACGREASEWRVRVFALAGSFHGGNALASVRVGRTGRAKAVNVRLESVAPRQQRYEVALGDSLAVGFASPPGESYVQNLFAHYSGSVPGLTLVNFGCSGATSTSLMRGGGCSFPGRVSQLGAAESFLREHAGQVRLITIDIGGNDFLACLSSPAADTACFDRVLGNLQRHLTLILARLRAVAGRSVPIVSMSYFNPALVHWFAGPAGQARARASVSAAARLTAVIRSVYEPAGSRVADVEGAFAANDFTMHQDTPWGPLPTNVMRVCQWLNNRCPAPGAPSNLGSGGVDTNAAGSRAISAAFEKVIPPLAK